MAVVKESSANQFSYELSNKKEYIFICQFTVVHPTYFKGQVDLELVLDVVQL
jgi:hypothetical protein